MRTAVLGTPTLRKSRIRRHSPLADDADRGSRALELSDKLLQHSIWPSVEAVSQGEELPAPLIVELDPTSFCDLACPGCISGDLLNQVRFGAGRLEDLAAELVEAGVHGVILIGGGEPLLHRAVGRVVRTLSLGGIAVGLTTNGTQIHRYIDDIAVHVTWTRVSVDASTETTFNRVRPRRAGASPFSQIIGNMQALAAVKRGTLGFSFMLRLPSSGTPEESNANEIFSAAKLAENIGCDYFELKPEYDSQHYLRTLSPDLRSAVKAEVEQVRALDRPGFRIIAPRTLQEVLAATAALEPKVYSSCPAVSLRTLLTASGAYLCPYHRGNSFARYGDPTSTSFDKLWNGPARQLAIERLNPSRDCQFHCIRHQSNLRILDAAASRPEELLPDFDVFI